MKLWKYIAILCLLSHTAIAQQHVPEFSMFTLNGVIRNPAFAGSNEVFVSSLAAREKWTGIKGAPSTQALTVHSPLKNNKFALGGLVSNERIGWQNTTSLFLDYTFRITFARSKLALGLRGGVSMYSENNSEIALSDRTASDPVFTPVGTSFMPNAGVGVYYFRKSFYAGVSIPLLLAYRHAANANQMELYHSFNAYNYCGLAGFRIPVGSAVVVKPALALNYLAPNLMYDANLTLGILDEKINAGFSYRSSNELIATLLARVNYQFRVGYAYDYSLDPLEKYRKGSHELVLQYEFKYRISAANPRNF